MYLESDDAYLYPTGETLTVHSQAIVNGEEALATRTRKPARGARYAPSAPAAGGRTVTWHAHEDVHESVRQRIKEQPEVYKRRAPKVEKDFGSIKWSMGCENLLVKGLRKCRGEWALLRSCYNLKRAISLVRGTRLLEDLEANIDAAA